MVEKRATARRTAARVVVEKGREVWVKRTVAGSFDCAAHALA